jgi:hypothetical protein
MKPITLKNKGMSKFITTASLNLRRQPQIIKGNVLGVMPPDTVVEEINPDVQAGFRQIKTRLANILVEGFASQKYLELTDLPLSEIEEHLPIPAVHYPPRNRVINRNGIARVYPLNEPGLIKIDLRNVHDDAERRKSIHNLLNYLDVERSARYAPDSSSTFCNIYAYDIAYCLGTYLPRVWWTSDAIVKIQQQVNVPIQYDKTVTEFTANRIADWFEKYGEVFGWQRLFDLTAFQSEVNKGQLGILVAQRVNMNNPGHIVAVVPEIPMHEAKRNSGIVVVPLQSQAGRNNKKYTVANAWWEDTSRFKKFGYWLWKL